MEDYHEPIPLFKSCGFIPTRGPTGPPHPPPMGPMIAAEGERTHALIYIPTHPDDVAHVPPGQSGFFHIVYAPGDLPQTPPEEPNFHWIHEPGRMQPLIGTPRLQRTNCLFLAAPSNMRVPEMYRRVSSVLNNKAVAKIREFFRGIVEPAALLVWQQQQQRNHVVLVQDPATEQGQPPQALPECPICTQVNPVFKVFVPCGHRVCVQCEKTMDRVGTMTCHMCRRLRLVSTFETPGELFKMTMGLHKRDYVVHHHQSLASGWISEAMPALDMEEEEEHQVTYRELRDRFHWETPVSFLESLEEGHYNMQDPLVQYLARFAETDRRRLRIAAEANDLVLLDPPLSGLTLPPHRLYIALIHYCLDMLTLPRSVEFQRNKSYKHEKMALDLVMLFLVPTDEYSPRGPERMYSLQGWLRHGWVVQARLRKTLYGCARANASGGRGSGHGTPMRDLPGVIENRPIQRKFLYLGVERWVWITQSIEVLLTWIRLAVQAEYLWVPPYVVVEKDPSGRESSMTTVTLLERKRPAEEQLSLEYRPHCRHHHRGEWETVADSAEDRQDIAIATASVPEGGFTVNGPNHRSLLSVVSTLPICQAL